VERKVDSGLIAEEAIFTDRNIWNEVRVFVSSTFTDFFAEREILVKHVFPRLRWDHLGC